MKTKLWRIVGSDPVGYTHYIGSDSEQGAIAYGEQLGNEYDWFVGKCNVLYFDNYENVVGEGEKFILFVKDA